MFVSLAFLVLVPCGADKEIGHVVGMIKQNGNLSELIDELQKNYACII